MMKNIFRDSRGAAFVELAIAAPVLLVLALGAVDFGHIMTSFATLESSVRSGVEIVKSNPKAVVGDMAGLFPSDATVAVGAAVCYCTDDSTLSSPKTCPASDVTATDATNPCLGKTNAFTGKPDTRVLKYITVSASQPFSAIYTSFGLPSTLRGSATARIQ